MLEELVHCQIYGTGSNDNGVIGKEHVVDLFQLTRIETNQVIKKVQMVYSINNNYTCTI